VIPELSPIPPEPGLSVYVHIPFCRGKCRYCDFYSVTRWDDSALEKILSETLAEARFMLSRLGHPAVKTVFIGGGTPSAVPAGMLKRFIAELGLLFPNAPEEWTVEANPESLSTELLEVLEANGVNRLSMGVQSFSDRLLGTLGRRANSAHVRTALERIASSWTGRYSIDLITGTPGQTFDEGVRDIEEALSYDPGHVSLYTLTIEPGTPLARDIASGALAELPAEFADAIWFESVSRFETAGYRQYEISNFARPGLESLHNQRYWLMLPYAGFGPAAVSTLPTPQGPVRLGNPRNLVKFSAGESAHWNVSSERLTPDEFLLEHIMMGLRLSDGIPLSRIERVFGLDLAELAPDTYKTWMDLGSLRIRNGRFALTPKGRPLLDRFLSELVDEIGGRRQTVRHVLWP
jgi:oxygen-independent coproporphyrinogen-3 oxidase